MASRSVHSATSRAATRGSGLPRSAAALFLLLGLTAGALPAETLPEAVASGDHAAVRTLLQNGADVNQAGADGMTPLHQAVRNDDLEIAALLLQAGADAQAATREGITPLWLAAMNRNAGMAEALLNAGADPNAALPGGETTLMAAARTGSAQLVELLLDHGADIAATGPSFGETALMVAAIEDHPDVIRVLVARGAEVDGRSATLSYSKDRFGLEGVVTILPPGNWTALMYAAREGSIHAVEALADAGADLNAEDPDGTRPLLLAITNSHYDTAALLIDKGADPNATDSSGMAALYAAVDMNTLGEIFGRPGRVSPAKLSALDLMKVLLEHGANPNAGLTGAALQRAHTPGEPTLKAGATPLARAAKNGDVAAIELLIAHGADVNQPLENGTTPLMFAAGLGRGVSAFAKDYGTEADQLAALTVLAEHGAAINAISDAGQTAMHFAAQATDANFPQPSDDLVKFLASRGARVDVVDKQGRTPVEMAEGKGLRGRAGGPVKPREGTIALLQELQAKAAASARRSDTRRSEK